jgi:hypothetical protein
MRIERIERIERSGTKLKMTHKVGPTNFKIDQKDELVGRPVTWSNGTYGGRVVGVGAREGVPPMVGGGNVNDDVWVCVEYPKTLNNPNQDDGAYRVPRTELKEISEAYYDGLRCK